MNSASTNPQTKKTATVPPRRGQIKAQIFESFGETVSAVASKAGEALRKLMGMGGTDVGSPASTTPSPTPIQTPSSEASPES